jgi:hypothetical protein
MINKTYQHQSDAGRLTSEIIASGKTQYPTTGFRFYGVNTGVTDGQYYTELMFADDITQQEITEVDAIVAATVPVPLPQPVTPVDSENKPYVRAEARPLNCTTIFTGSGDKFEDSNGPAEIGGGTRITWDSSIPGDFTPVGAPVGTMQKTIDLLFLDTVYLRAGIVFSNCEYEDYLDLYVMAPNGYPYIKNDGTPAQNLTGSPIAIEHSVVKFPLHVAGHMTLDSGTASGGIPSGYIVRAVITIPDDDVDCKGSAILMMYRPRTVVLE